MTIEMDALAAVVTLALNHFNGFQTPHTKQCVNASKETIKMVPNSSNATLNPQPKGGENERLSFMRDEACSH
jgi:hypothetical protein